MPTQSLDEIVKEQAVLFADQIQQAAQFAEKEEEIRIAAERALALITRDTGITLRGRHEHTIGTGRADSVYGCVIIEYKNPHDTSSQLSSNVDAAGNQKVIKQIQKRFADFKQEHNVPLNTMFGIGSDGNYFIFVRYRDERWFVEDPVLVTRYSAERFLWALINMGTKGKAFSPEYLAGDFGSDSPLSHEGIRAIYDTICTTTSTKATIFFQQWQILFGEVCGFDVNTPSDKIKKLAEFYGIEEDAIRPAELLFSIHTYYSIFMKLMASEIVAFFHKLPTPLQKILKAPTSTKLKEEMDDLESGSIFQHLNITNFLEGDLFAWYPDAWNDSFDNLIRDMANKLDGYNPGTLSEDPAGSRDLLKKLYQQLFPKSVRHDLGEYYTPDWLAEHVIENEIQEIDQLLKMPVKRDKKLYELFRLIRRIDEEAPRKEKEKVLIFTEYRRTQDHIVAELEKKYGKGSVIVIHGGMKLENIQDEKEDINILWRELQEKGAMQTCTAKRTSQRLFWEHENVRFLVSTEAGGEGINLQCSHIVVNYDSPWNPMRKEQRIGRVYRYGQDKVVQIYNFYNQGTIEERVQTYSEDKIERAAEAISKVTHEDPEEIIATLNGQLENQFNPEKIYSRALVEGTLNEQTQMELSEAMERAKRAYELARTSLFRQVTSYSYDKYQTELATDLSLRDIQGLIEQFLKMHRRQIQVEDGIYSFITPEVLKSDNIKDRYPAVTFERETAMKRSDIDFFAIGHPFVDNILSYIGSYDFGGLNAKREIRDRDLAGTGGFLFNFIVKKVISQELGDEYLFVSYSVFLDDAGNINPKALKSAITKKSESVETFQDKISIQDKFEKVRGYLEEKVDIWDWEEEVDLINVARVEFK